MNEELYSRLKNIPPLDKYVVDQGLMLNYLVGALTTRVKMSDDNGNINGELIVESVERAFDYARKTV